jgi:pantoate--beta-alanine ligase
VLFTPTAEDLYGGEPFAPSVDYGELTRVLEAAHRRGHFDGVIAVVDRLFDAVKPSRAYFGEKDLQQLAVVRELAKRQHQAIEVVGCALVRDSNGIALSSRNARLSDQGMRTARELSIALRAIAEAGGRWPLVLQEERSRLSADRRIDLEYLEMIVGDTFTNADPSITSEEQGLWAVIAAQVEGVRLIDNMELVSSQSELKKPTQN